MSTDGWGRLPHDREPEARGGRYLDLGSFRSKTENAVLPNGTVPALPYDEAVATSPPAT